MNSALKLTVILICCIVFGYVSKKVATTVPWMGVLLYKPDNQSNSEATHIVMIGYQIALANARDIGAVKWNSLMRYGKALFYSGDAPWEVGIDGHVLHPEYKNGSVNTIAILFLESNEIAHLWKPIKLIEDTEKVNRLSKIFSVGYTDHNHVLAQEMNAMEYVSQSTCKDFYVQEELDMEFLWPSNPICFRVLDARETCVNDAGMALATNSTDEWLLMGLGTYGPGCSLPARYIEILPYAKWIKDNAATRLAVRRTTYVEGVKSYPFNRPYEDEKLLKRFQDASFTLYSEYANKTTTVQGCYYPDDNKTLIYIDSGYIKDHDVAYDRNYGIYKVDIIDTTFEQITCVTVFCNCLERSYVSYGVERNKQNYPQTPMFGKSVPFRVRDIPREGVPVLVNDRKPITGLDTYYLYFRFSFKRYAYIEVRVYGKFNGTKT